MEDLPYKAEYAKSGRASCKGCKDTINKDVLRMAIMVQSPHFDGKMPMWYHFDCFFRKKLLASVGDVANFQSLRWEDQQRIKNKIVGGGGDAGSSATTSNKASGGKKPKKAKKSEASPDAANSGLQEFSVEYAKSSRSSCKGCSQSIPKNEVRVSKMIYDDESAARYGPHPGWYHVDCFVRNRNDLGFTEAADKLPGFTALSNDDKDMLKEKIKSTGKKRKLENEKPAVPAKKAKVLEEEEKALAAQSKIIFGFRDKLSQLSKKECTLLLEHNDQGVPPGESRILDSLSDIMAFGAIEPCPDCKTGQLRFKDGTYKCTGDLTEWTKCMYVTSTPKRRPFLVPEDLSEKYDFLASYKYVKRDRVIPSVVEAPLVRKTANSAPRPLENFKIALVGDLEKSQEAITAAVADLGGQIVKTVNSSVTCIISTQDEVDKKSKKIKSAEKHGVHVVSEKFLDDVKNGGAVLMMKQNLLSTWGGDPTSKVERLTEKSKSSKKETKSSTVKVTVQGPAAVHPESGLQDETTVYEKGGVVYDVVLNRCDISKGYNSYYKMQILVAKYGRCFYLFRMWGRVGTTIGSDKLDSFDTSEDAISEFESQYLDKTGNKWKNRKNFVKQPGLYCPIEIDHGQDINELQTAKLEAGSGSSLEKAVQDLIVLIFDIEAMKKTMVEFEIDLKKMPLGKLSKKQVDKAYAVLTELQQIIEGDKNHNKLLDASNRFYTLIPHDFGMKKPPLLDSEAAIKAKIEMLDSLLEIEFAYSLLKGGDKADGENPIDKHYHQLKTDIEVVDKSSDDYERIEKYLSNTHAKTHDHYTLHLEEAFKISRHGEYDRYKKFETLHNRKLLWHGSRITNFAGILSQGLRIAPPEAPSTGYMFGKGIYFADMVSKSANYCFTSRTNNTGLLLLCEVALGDMYEKTMAEFVTQLPPDKHSTKGLGQTAPNPKQAITTSDGVEIPLGKPKHTNVSNSSLLYNEYIVYDVAQVNIKYLLKVNFKYKY